MILTFMTATLALSVALMVLNYLIGANQIMSREKASIFECGFDPSTASRLPFSMHFFLVALIFLIFDVEISLLVPLPLIWSKVSHSMLLWVASSVLALLLVGALVEWVEGSLEWQA